MSNKIFEERQAFNFYKSYYDTSLLLYGDDKLQFLEAILNYQFTGEIKEPVLPMALLAFRGQIHSLKKQVTGYIKGKGTYPYGNPTKGEGKGEGKEVQVQVQVQEKEEVKDELINYRAFGHLCISISEFNKLILEGFTKEQIDNTLNSVENFKGNKKYKSLYLTALNWLKKNNPTVKKDILNETAEEKDLRIRIESFKKIKVH